MIKKVKLKLTKSVFDVGIKLFTPYLKEILLEHGLSIESLEIEGLSNRIIKDDLLNILNMLPNLEYLSITDLLNDSTSRNIKIPLQEEVVNLLMLKELKLNFCDSQIAGIFNDLSPGVLEILELTNIFIYSGFLDRMFHQQWNINKLRIDYGMIDPSTNIYYGDKLEDCQDKFNLIKDQETKWNIPTDHFHLTHLRLKEFVLEKDNESEMFINSIKNQHHLVSLDLDDTVIKEATLGAICNLKQLECLRFRVEFFNHEGLLHLKSISGIRELTIINSNTFDDDYMKTISYLRLPSLLKLNLELTELDSNDEYLVRISDNLPSLRTLKIRVALRSSTIITILTSFQQLKVLKLITYGSPADFNTNFLSNVKCKNTKLRKLEIAGDIIKPNNLITTISNNFSNLKKLKLSFKECPTEEVIQEVRKSCHKIKFIKIKQK
ncbi:unnamed protein product [Diamesa hyperborea]